MRKIDTLIIHCAGVDYGDVKLYKEWHLANGWDDIGYHYVILNCYPTKKSFDDKKPVFLNDGKLENGRDVSVQGAHVKNHNEGSIGICLVGDRVFSAKQFESLKILVDILKKQFNITTIKGHYEYDTAKAQGKTCPNIEMDYLRKLLETKET